MKKKFFVSFLLSLYIITSAALAQSVTVCILDSGSNVEGAKGWNFALDSQDLTDAVGHGSRIYSALRGGAPNAEIFMLKCFESEESIDEGAVIRALRAAVDDYNADVVNMSFANASASDALHEAVVYAYENDVILIASTGNLGFSLPLGSTTYPAAWDEVIGVGGVNVDEMGEVETSLWYLTGDMVYVCARADYDGEKGTSYAAARVSAVVCEYLASGGEKTQDGVREMLREKAQDTGDPGYDTTFGWGYIAVD